MTTVLSPERTLEQRMAALELANRIRVYRAHLKQRIKTGDVLVADVVADPADEVLTMKVVDLIAALPWKSERKAVEILRLLRISSAKTVGGLTVRQRDAVVEALQ